MEFVKHFKLNCYGTLPKGEWLLQSHSSRCSAHTKEMVSGSFTRSLWGLSITLRIPTFWKSLMLVLTFVFHCGEIVKFVNSYISLTTHAIVGTLNWMTESDSISGSRIWKFVVEYDVQSQGDGVVAIAWFNHTFTSIPNPRPATSRMKVQALLRITYVLVLCTFAHLIHHFTD